MAGSQNPELQRLLATLGGYGSPYGENAGHEVRPDVEDQQTHVSAFSSPAIPGLGLLPEATAQLPLPEPLIPNMTRSRSAQPAQSDIASSTTPSITSRINSPAPPIPDAAIITTWPAAVKHVTKYLASDEKVSTRIRHLISEQHKHERQWWQGREELVARQQGRSGTSAQISALLKSLGGTDSPIMPSDPANARAELDAYDSKVYKSLLSMTTDFDRQLRTLGIPFFAIKYDLVILEEGRERPGAAKGRIDKGELRELQKRMLQHLEDLFGD